MNRGTSPLGSLPAFAPWSSARSWGPDGRWQVTLGPGDRVIANLLDGLCAHPGAVERGFPLKAEAYPVVLDCVPWLTSSDVVDALLAIT
jgi:hypothetical protein